MKRIILFLWVVFSVGEAWSACNCGSTSMGTPCTGQSIDVTVVAGTPNGGTAVNSEYHWSFNSGGGDARCGQFANGDYWVAPASGQSSVTVTAITSNGSVAADVNPEVESMGLLSSSKTYGNYNSSENIIPNLPQSFSSISSIVAAVQRNEAVEGNCGTSAILGSCADSYNVVTILTSVPEKAGSETIRPNITGTTKEIITFYDLNFSRIPSKSFLAGTNAAGLELIRKKWSHSVEIFGLHNAAGTSAGYCSEGGRAFRSHTLLDDYGGGVASAWYNDLMILFSDKHTILEKKPALAAMFAYGLDLYHAMYDAPVGVKRDWGTGATQHPGKFITSALLAAVQTDSSKANRLKEVSAHAWDNVYTGPLEIAQVHVGVNGPVWGDIPALSGVNFQGSYWVNLMKSQCYDGAPGTCNTAIGAKNMFDPYGYIDGPPNYPGTAYMVSSLGTQRSMVAASILMPELRVIINYEPLFDYVYRTAIHGIQAANDPCVTPDSREDFTTCDPYRNTGCTYYGVTWGPVTPSSKTSQCITTETPPYTHKGRFATRDGVAVGKSYVSPQIEANWSTIVALDPGYPVIIPDPEATCSDGIQNGTETGIDCGGSCSACPPGTIGSFLPFKSNGKATKISQ